MQDKHPTDEVGNNQTGTRGHTPTDSLVYRLRKVTGHWSETALAAEAADELERLREQQGHLLAERASLLAATGGLAPAIVAKALNLVKGSATATRARDGIFTLTERRALTEATFEVLP